MSWSGNYSNTGAEYRPTDLPIILAQMNCNLQPLNSSASPSFENRKDAIQEKRTIDFFSSLQYWYGIFLFVYGPRAERTFGK